MEKCNKCTLKEMKIQNNLTMETIYQVIKNHILTKGKLENNFDLEINQDYKIHIYSYSEDFFSFKIQNDYFEVLSRPIKYKIEFNNQFKYLDIIIVSQLEDLIEKEFHLNEAIINCPECKKKFGICLDNLKIHEHHSGVCIKENLFTIKILKNNYSKIFKENFNFIGETLNPNEFEPNFKIYFKNCELILKEGKIKIFEDKQKNRKKIFNEIKAMNSRDSIKKYFGQPGKGKTLSIIGFLKYMTIHDYTGTFYINCKALFTLKEPVKMKQLIIDEIPFLFYNNFNDYEECANNINNFNFIKNISTFFNLINVVIDFIIKNPKKARYIIVFDQYNDKIDKNGTELEKLNNKLIRNKEKQIKNIIFNLITFSSMNNKDIRIYKVQYLNNILNNKDDKGNQIVEISNLDYDLSIDNGNIYDQYLDKLGFGLKYYNILNNYYRLLDSNKKDGILFSFIEDTKATIRDNLFEFFNISKDLSIYSNLDFLCSFSTNVAYSKEKLIPIINKIPFKYFNIVQNENKDEYIIKFSFPLVGEVVNKIYSDIINTNPHIYINITNDSNLDGGAKGKFFEKIVTHYLNIESGMYANVNTIDYFEDYPIKHHIEMDVLVLNSNEKYENISFKNKLEKGIYLVTQKRYNGKALDIAILNVSDMSEIIGIQISIHKNDIFTQEQVSEFLLSLKINIKNSYNLDIDNNNLFFCYIFEKNKHDIKMIEKCIKNDLNYFYFDVINEIFVDKFGNKVVQLKPNLSKFSSFEFNISKKLNAYHKIEEFYSIKTNDKNDSNNQVIEIEECNPLKGPIIKFNNIQKEKIQTIIQKNFELDKLPKIKYLCSMDGLNSKLFSKNKKLFCISKYNGKNYEKNAQSIVLFTGSLNIKLINEYGNIFPYFGNYSDIFDYYIFDV